MEMRIKASLHADLTQSSTQDQAVTMLPAAFAFPSETSLVASSLIGSPSCLLQHANDSIVMCEHGRDQPHSIVQQFKTALLSAGIAGSILCGNLVVPPQLEAAPIASRANVVDEDLLNQLLNSGRLLLAVQVA